MRFFNARVRFDLSVITACRLYSVETLMKLSG